MPIPRIFMGLKIMMNVELCILVRSSSYRGQLILQRGFDGGMKNEGEIHPCCNWYIRPGIGKY